MSPEESSTTGTAQRNVETISRLEKRAWEDRTVVERLIDHVAGLASSPTSVLAHSLIIFGWIGWNALGPYRFDPYPFSILGLGATLEAILLALFILGSQRRLSRQADRRAHLDLQVSLLVEAQGTKTLSVLQALSRKFELDESGDDELNELAERTNIETLHGAVQDSFPD